jgi:hypothetical protein
MPFPGEKNMHNKMTKKVNITLFLNSQIMLVIGRITVHKNCI